MPVYATVNRAQALRPQIPYIPARKASMSLYGVAAFRVAICPPCAPSLVLNLCSELMNTLYIERRLTRYLQTFGPCASIHVAIAVYGVVGGLITASCSHQHECSSYSPRNPAVEQRRQCTVVSRGYRSQTRWKGSPQTYTPRTH